MLEFGESTALSLGVTYSLKYSVDERRPNGGRHAFPSGHTAIASTAAQFVGQRYGWEYGLPAYAATTFIGYSRVESKEHQVHDVLAGAAIGALSSYLFTKPYEGFEVQAESDGKSSLVELTRRW